MADPLAEVSDLEDRLGVSITDTDQATAILTDASAAVRDAAYGQLISAGTSTVWLKVRRGFVRLPQRPVTAVTTVVDEHNNAVPHSWLGDDRLRLDYGDAINAWEIEPYRNPLGEVKVTYNHGYTAGNVPDLVVAIVCNVALRALGRDPRDGGISQENIEGYGYQIGSVGAAGPVGLLPEEKLRLESFFRPHLPAYAGA